MAVSLNGIPTYGDGVPGPTQGIDTDCNGAADDSRMFQAKQALTNMVLAFGDIEFAMTSFPRFARSNVACNYPRGGSALTHQIQTQECNIAAGPFVGGIGDPTQNNGAAISLANCGGEWDGDPAPELPTDLIPAACRPGVGGRPPARFWATGSPQFCTNYLGGCPGFRPDGVYTLPQGDVLVGFSGFAGWPAGVDNRPGILKWIDNSESSFNTSTTVGNFCNHAGGGNCELRPQGPTPLGGVLRAAADHIIPIRAADPVGDCRPYTVMLITDGTETCGGDPVAVADELFRLNNIPVYVVGLAVAGGRAQLNAIATAGGTDVGAPGGDTAFFADEAVELSAGLSDIVADSLLVEVCNDIDDDCDSRIDEGFVKYCDRPRGVGGEVLCVDPGETVCNDIDDNCDGRVDEGLLNACGTCGPVPMEICDGLDNDCDGAIDEGGVCDACRPEPEICDNRDNDCDGAIDEDLSRACGVDIGECSAGRQTCTRGRWGMCSDTGPTDEICDGLDNDCDGIADNLTRACGTDVGECSPGLQRCVSGSFRACMGDVGPRAEICDSLDNDCDGTVDEDVAGVGAPCGLDEGVCASGVTACAAGAIVCEGGVGPGEEVCDGLDNDCDGLIDDGIFVGTPCGTDVGECSPGFTRCVDGDIECIDAIGGSDEVCDGLDNDCDGSVDEMLGIGEPCGVDEGICEPGALRCVDGEPTCVGAVPPGIERCNCEDDDCDGTVDEDSGSTSICPGDSECVMCQCALECAVTEFGFGCPTGRAPTTVDGECFCVADACDDDECAGQTVERDGEVLCAPGEDGVPTCVCKDNECTFSCEGVVCDEGTACDPFDPRGRCVEDTCRGLGCEEGFICDVVGGECQEDPCASVTCPDDQACRLGECEASCADVMCADDEICRAGGCEMDLCVETECSPGNVCNPEDGLCTADLCDPALRCPEGSVCNPVTGSCELDPCAVLHCPDDEMCVDGECAAMSVMPPDAGVDAGLDAGDTGSGSTDDRERILATGAGGCANCAVVDRRDDGRSGLFVLFGLLALFVRRRRDGAVRGGLMLPFLIAAIAAAGTLSGCEVDPYCVDCVDAGVDTNPLPDTGRPDTQRDTERPDTELPDTAPDVDAGCTPGAPEDCDGEDNDCDGLVDEGIDTDSDPSNCGRCGFECNPPGAFPTCIAGVCGLGACDVGFYDLDGDPDNGCEYRCLPSAEDDTLCDLRDNDCDGAVDEDVDTDSDPLNCGDCGRACRFARATAMCTAGTCGIAACLDGFYNLDGIEGNGCEYACLETADLGPETCNARDDDCDGMIDEGNPDGGGRCGETAGECTAGREMCVGGALACMGEGGPTPESCNTRDDDCDGRTDEETDFNNDPNNCGSCGMTCSAPNAITRCVGGSCTVIGCEPGFVDLSPAAPGCEYECDVRGAEVCNGEDDDCDMRVDESLVRPPNFCNRNGVCSGTRPSCDPARGWICDYTDPRYQESEASCDNVDNDCDGGIDETFPTKGDACTNGLGVCQRTGTIRCSADGLAVECSAAMAGAGMAETCDGEDNDCDGVTDEGISPSSMPTVRITSGGRSIDMFQYEASRPDATGSAAGSISTSACSRAGVIPWSTVTWNEARDACCALNDGGVCAGSTGWRLCDAADWQAACEGPAATDCTWSYSASCTSSSPSRCNGSERDCDPGVAGNQDCALRTGALSACGTNWSGGRIYDLSGNLKEWTNTAALPGVHEIRGGSYNNIEAGRTCQFDFTVSADDFAFPNTGFRCCNYR